MNKVLNAIKNSKILKGLLLLLPFLAVSAESAQAQRHHHGKKVSRAHKRAHVKRGAQAKKGLTAQARAARAQVRAEARAARAQARAQARAARLQSRAAKKSRVTRGRRGVSTPTPVAVAPSVVVAPVGGVAPGAGVPPAPPVAPGAGAPPIVPAAGPGAAPVAVAPPVAPPIAPAVVAPPIAPGAGIGGGAPGVGAGGPPPAPPVVPVAAPMPKAGVGGIAPPPPPPGPMVKKGAVAAGAVIPPVVAPPAGAGPGVGAGGPPPAPPVVPVAAPMAKAGVGGIAPPPPPPGPMVKKGAAAAGAVIPPVVAPPAGAGPGVGAGGQQGPGMAKGAPPPPPPGGPGAVKGKGNAPAAGAPAAPPPPGVAPKPKLPAGAGPLPFDPAALQWAIGKLKPAGQVNAAQKPVVQQQGGVQQQLQQALQGMGNIPQQPIDPAKQAKQAAKQAKQAAKQAAQKQAAIDAAILAAQQAPQPGAAQVPLSTISNKFASQKQSFENALGNPNASLDDITKEGQVFLKTLGGLQGETEKGFSKLQKKMTKAEDLKYAKENFIFQTTQRQNAIDKIDQLKNPTQQETAKKLVLQQEIQDLDAQFNQKLAGHFPKLAGKMGAQQTAMDNLLKSSDDLLLNAARSAFDLKDIAFEQINGVMRVYSKLNPGSNESKEALELIKSSLMSLHTAKSSLLDISSRDNKLANPKGLVKKTDLNELDTTIAATQKFLQTNAPKVAAKPVAKVIDPFAANPMKALQQQQKDDEDDW